MHKTVIFTFREDPMCFIHVLLNALDMQQKGFETGIVFEGKATTLPGLLALVDHPMNGLYVRVMEKGLIFGACRACSAKAGATESIVSQGISLLDDMNGHPGMGAFIEAGYNILTM